MADGTRLGPPPQTDRSPRSGAEENRPSRAARSGPPSRTSQLSRVISDRALAWWLLIAGLVGLAAAGTLLVEKIRLLTDPSYEPSCSLNPVLSCGSVMVTPQAEVLGFPNPVIGVAAFPVLLVTGVTVLAGARLAPWYWRGLQVGVTAGAAFVCWLIFQSLYRIGALCPYCMIVWAMVLPTFCYVSLRNLDAGIFGSAAARSRVTRLALSGHAFVVLAVGLVVAGLVLQRFWYYWSTLL